VLVLYWTVTGESKVNMKQSDLPSPGKIRIAHELRARAAEAISGVQVFAKKNASGKARTAKQLSDFFTACATALSGFIDATAPTVSTRVRTATNTLTITFSEALDTGVVPATSAFVLTPTRTVTAVSVVGSTVVVTATGVVATDSVAYTKPATKALRDRVGNQVASFSGVIA